MDAITSIKLALGEWIAEDPATRKYAHLEGRDLTFVCRRANEIEIQRMKLEAERYDLDVHEAMVDQEEVIWCDRPRPCISMGPSFRF